MASHQKLLIFCQNFFDILTDQMKPTRIFAKRKCLLKKINFTSFEDYLY